MSQFRRCTDLGTSNLTVCSLGQNAFVHRKSFSILRLSVWSTLVSTKS